MTVADLSRAIAVEGGRIYAELMKRGEEIELNDCLIAATSLSLRIHEIVTINDKNMKTRLDLEHIKKSVEEFFVACYNNRP